MNHTTLKRGSRRPVSGREAGHTLLIVVLMVAIMAIGMTVGMRVWSTVIKREKEDELIFRGQQYSMAIYLFRKQRGTLPTDLKQLMELGPGQSYVLRQPYKDPITGQDFGIIMAGPNNTPIPDEPVEYGEGDSTSAFGTQGFGSSANSAFSTSGQTKPAQGGAFGQGSGRPSAFGQPGDAGGAGGFNQMQAGGGMAGVPAAGQTTSGGLPIMGVHSKSRDTAMAPAKWHDLDRYNQWFFLVTDVTGVGQVPRVQAPGLPGQPGQGGGQGGRGAIPGGTGGRGFGGGGGKPNPDGQ